MSWPAAGVATPIVCGHRGAPAVAPENTLVGFGAAAECGATWIEFDVRPTADGDLVIHHDPVTATGAHIASSNRADLDPKIPSFESLATLPELGLDIEMKADDIGISPRSYAELVVDQIERFVLDRPMMVTSFDPEVLAMVRELRPDVATGLLFHDRPAAAVDRAVADGHVAIAPWIEILDAELVDRARGASLAIATWTVNEAQQIDRALGHGVDMIIGDDPKRIVEKL